MADQLARGQYDIYCEEPYDDDTVDADEEYPREDDDGHPGPFTSVGQIVAYYERFKIFDEGDEGTDALGS